MTAKIKNIIIFAVAIVCLVLIYIFFIKKAPEQQNLVSSVSGVTTTANNTLNQNPSISKDLLSVLLSVKNIKLDDSIFSSKAFSSLRDSTILLSPLSPGDEGRSNPFAPIGVELNPPPLVSDNAPPASADITAPAPSPNTTPAPAPNTKTKKPK